MGYDVTITRQPLRALFDIQGAPDRVANWCGPVLPPFPNRPNSLMARDGREMMWVGPDQWLLSAGIEEEEELCTALRLEEAPAEIAIVLVSDTLAHFTVIGSDATEVLAIATPLDLNPAAFAADSVSQSEAFGTKALIRRVGGGFEIAVDRSYDDWFATYLAKVIA